MFTVSDKLDDLNVKERNIFKIIYSMNSHPVATPDMNVEEARCYILFFSEGPNLSSYIGLYLPHNDRKFFYAYTSNPFPFEAAADVEGEARQFAEDMGFLLDEIDIAGMPADDRNHWIEDQFIFGYKKPELTHDQERKAEDTGQEPAETREAAPKPERRTEQETLPQAESKSAAAPAPAVELAAPAPAPAQAAPFQPAAEPAAPQPPAYPAYQQPVQPQYPQAPQPQYPQQYPPQQPMPGQPYMPQQPYPGYPQQGQPPMPQYPQAPQPQYPQQYPPQQPMPGQPYVPQQPYPGYPQPMPPQYPPVQQPPDMKVPELVVPEEPTAQKAKTAAPQKPASKKKAPAPKSAPSPSRPARRAVEESENEVPVELEAEASPARPRNVMDDAIRQGVVKPPKPKAQQAPQGTAGTVTRDKEALARLLASF